MSTARPCCDPDAPSAGGCACGDPAAAVLVPAERNRFFTGKYMTARDFTAEQAYFLSRHRLHQRALHGAGIACGLDVVPHPDGQCAADGTVTVTPGIALDCYGREVVVRKPLSVNLAEMLDYHSDCDAKREPPTEGKHDLLLGVWYTAAGAELVPVLADEDGCAPRKDHNRIREGSAVGWITASAGKECWGRNRRPCRPCPPNVPPTETDIPDSLTEVLEPLCDEKCGGFVPLARLTFQLPAKTVKDKDLELVIDKTGRRHLPGPLDPGQLTHICGVNWSHGGRTCAGDLPPERTSTEAKWGSKWDHQWVRLTVTFDRPLAKDHPAGPEVPGLAALNRLFVVRYESDHGFLAPLPGACETQVTLSECRRHLHYITQLHRPTKGRSWVVHITLDCDFLTDEFGRAVDGDHLSGSLGRPKDDPLLGPSGDGVEGGTFESWFQLDW